MDKFQNLSRKQKRTEEKGRVREEGRGEEGRERRWGNIN